MNSRFPLQPIIYCVEIDRNQRWILYHRLQELEMTCYCSSDRPLQVELNNALAIAQLYFAVKQLTSSRSESIEWLNRCWTI